MVKVAPSLPANHLRLLLGSLLLVEPFRWLVGRLLDHLADNARLSWAGSLSDAFQAAQPFVVGGVAAGMFMVVWANWPALKTWIPRPREPSSGDGLTARATVQPPPLKLTSEEAERRIRAIDEMYEVLNTQGANVYEHGRGLAEPMRDSIFYNGPADVNAGMNVWRGLLLDFLKAVTATRQRHSLQEHVYPKSLFAFEFTARLSKAFDELTGDIGLLGNLHEKITRNHVLLIDHRIVPFQKAVNVLGEWLGQQKTELKAIRESILRAAP